MVFRKNSLKTTNDKCTVLARMSPIKPKLNLEDLQWHNGGQWNCGFER